MTISTVDAGPRNVSRTVDVAAPAAELFNLVADPRRHHELDGSGTVVETVSGPERLALGERFSVKMRQYGFPYRITSRVTTFDDGHLLEWRHPAGHHWRWEFVPLSDGATRVTETFDYSRITTMHGKALELLRQPERNASGIEATLRQLVQRYAG